MKYMEQIGMRSKATSRSIGLLGQNRRNEALKQAAKELKKQAAFLLEENQKDIANAREKGMKESLIDRLMLNALQELQMGCYRLRIWKIQSEW